MSPVTAAPVPGPPRAASERACEHTPQQRVTVEDTWFEALPE